MGILDAVMGCLRIADIILIERQDLLADPLRW